MVTRESKAQIGAREEILLEAFRRLPAETANELSALAQRLATQSPQTTIDWSDSWSDADLREFTAASLRRLDEEGSEAFLETMGRAFPGQFVEGGPTQSQIAGVTSCDRSRSQILRPSVCLFPGLMNSMQSVHLNLYAERLQRPRQARTPDHLARSSRRCASPLPDWLGSDHGVLGNCLDSGAKG